MKYALQSNQRLEVTPKASGNCLCCGTEVLAVCGTKKVWHWRHKAKLNCDHWWENETQWHRDWKNHFPEEWQEVVHFAEDGEKHIADVKTNKGMVIEFQHSAISAEEKLARENFYQNMIWVIDGRRLKRDFSRFDKACTDWRVWPHSCITALQFSEFVLPKDWLMRSVPLVFDWGMDSGGGQGQPVLSNNLICVLPSKNEYSPARCFPIQRKQFIRMVIEKQNLQIPEHQNIT
ncbi:MAG: competence protein CoiA family protein [Ascidiaceihabitans sp.]|nr:competence protein CoiA family protein [Ascidiaceihabitans sp.]